MPSDSELFASHQEMKHLYEYCIMIQKFPKFLDIKHLLYFRKLFCHLHNCFKMCRQTSKQLSSLIWICAVLFVYTYFKFVQNLRIITIRVAECYNDNLFIFICRRMYLVILVCHLA